MKTKKTERKKDKEGAECTGVKWEKHQGATDGGTRGL